MLHKGIRLMKTGDNMLLYLCHLYFVKLHFMLIVRKLTLLKISSLFVSVAFSWPGTNILYGHCKIFHTQALKFYVPCNLNNIEKILLVILEMMDSA